jgi:RNA polymerase sigma factor (sigma-70 family)
MSSPAQRFLDALPQIDALSAALAKRHGLNGDDALDFVALVRTRFVETDYAPIRQFRGEASLTTYLAVVIASWVRDHRVAQTGRWRPSAAALREGPAGVLLERLTHRDGRTHTEAIEDVRSSTVGVYSERELRAILRRLPMRPPTRPRIVSTDAAADVPAPRASNPDELVEQGEQARRLDDAKGALARALQRLEATDRLVISLRFLDGLSVADIARTLGVEQKPLYRRIERSLAVLKQHLTAGGVTAGTIRDVLHPEP